MPAGDTSSPQPTPIRRRDYSRPNPTQSVEIELEPGRQRHLRLDFEALHNIHAQTGLVLWEGDDWEQIRRDPKTLSVVLREALAHEDPDLTPEAVRRMSNCNIANLPYIQDRFFRLYGVTLPDPVEVDSDEAVATADDGGADPNDGDRDSTSSGPTLWSSSDGPIASSGG